MLDFQSPLQADASALGALAKFYRMIPEVSLPVPADAAAGGTLPLRAYRYCEPIRVASQLGWYVFAPMDFSLMWDGTRVLWRYPDAPDWMPLDAAQFPNYAAQFDADAPDDVKGYSPPFLASVLQPGVVQIWSGLIAKTATDWCVLVREPANLPRTQHMESYEGVIETDRWFGPLFTNIRITKTDCPVEFKRDHPMFTIQPIHRAMLSPQVQKSTIKVAAMADMTDDDWAEYRATIVERVGEKRVVGEYATQSRKRRKSDDRAPS